MLACPHQPRSPHEIDLSLPLYFSLSAQEVVPPQKSFPDEIWLKVIQVIPGTADSLELINHNLKMMTLICAHNPIFATKESTITYTNYMNIEAMKFKFDEDQHCFNLKEYLTMTFEMITEQEPLFIKLKRSTGKVTKIVYPNIDPLEDGRLRFDLPKEEKLSNWQKTRHPLLATESPISGLCFFF